MMNATLPMIQLGPAVKAALAEDLGDAGDITSNSVVPAGEKMFAAIRAREFGRIAGIEAARIAFELVDPAIHVVLKVGEGADVAPGDVVLTIEGPARSILTAERTALNFMGHLCGIATLTRAYVRACGNHKARICATRKTLPGLRALQKYAVRVGGGLTHRYGLYDAIMIKDNHIAAAGGIAAAMERARKNAPGTMKIEIEVDTLDQLREALEAKAEIILLDNMDTDTLGRAVDLTGGRALLEASGGMKLERIPEVAATGVNFISVGALTHSAPNFDLGLDVV